MAASPLLAVWLASASAKPIQELEAACATGLATQCAVLGAIYREGTGVSVDECRAANLFDRACTLGSGDGCTGLGSMYEDGSCVQPSRSRAMALNEKGCAAGAGMGCNNLGHLYLAGGDGVPRNPERGYAYLRKACGMGITSACDVLPLDLQLGVRGELDLLGRDTWMTVTGEFERGSFALVTMIILRYPPALRLEGRAYPLRWGSLRPYAGVGVTYLLGIAVRGSAGIDLQISHLHLSVDLSWEHFFTEPVMEAGTFEPDYVPLALEVGWSF